MLDIARSDPGPRTRASRKDKTREAAPTASDHPEREGDRSDVTALG
jgi:hypothetical protein